MNGYMAIPPCCKSFCASPTLTYYVFGAEWTRSVINVVCTFEVIVFDDMTKAENNLGFNSILRAATCFSMSKLARIVDDIKDDAEQIEKLAPIIEARKAKGEREDA